MTTLHEADTEWARFRRGFRVIVSTLEFSPAIDSRLVRLVARTVELDSSAATWRRLRRRAGTLCTSTPCYESVRRLVARERDRRARLAATITTLADLATRRIPVLPEQVSRIHAQHLARRRGDRAPGLPRRPP